LRGDAVSSSETEPVSRPRPWLLPSGLVELDCQSYLDFDFQIATPPEELFHCVTSFQSAPETFRRAGILLDPVRVRNTEARSTDCRGRADVVTRAVFPLWLHST
ncbi:MAG: hypothetical protein WCF85_02390, partial [Rhodospirillaceae bacterium]